VTGSKHSLNLICC